MTAFLVRSPGSADVRAVCNESTFGYVSYSTAALPDRVYTGLDETRRPASLKHLQPAIDLEALPSPVALLADRAGGAAIKWPSASKAALARLEALWLLVGDRYRLLDSEAIEPLAHQASLVEHILSNADLRRVLVGDEVGLGKTVEAGLIIRRLIEASPGEPPRVLYLTEAQLVDNVVEELERLGLRPRRWSATAQEAKLRPGDSDPLVVASMHRAVFRLDGAVNHFETVSQSGPWDVLIIDEAHHLSDWSPDGTDPKQRMRLVRRLVDNRLVPNGRLILLTGTPHQGHDERFRNLLRLLSQDRSDENDARGKVIYRIKEDIRDWDDRPLFPAREVLAPTVVRVSPAYQGWLADVHALLAPRLGSRAAGWRRAQALQWCASSPQAGLAYLVRLALRFGVSEAECPALPAAVASLRPYRDGPADEPVDRLRERLLGSTELADPEDDVPFGDATELLDRVLARGSELIADDAIAEKLRTVFEWLDDHEGEKFVIFAQPVETVFTLRRRLEQHLGEGTVSLIVGSLPIEDRRRQIKRFIQDPKVRVLVSSRAGGEGINLQVSRRLVHFDVPWNPMEMEQRVGRIHRFGSVNTVVVYTMVLEGSREHRVLQRCRARLAAIVRDLDQDRFELLFSRTMSLVPMEELASLMAGEDFGPLTPREEERLDSLIKQGYERWQSTDTDFRKQMHEIATLRRGPVTEQDFESFLTRTLGATVVDGWRRRVLEQSGPDEEPKPVELPTRVLRLPDGTLGLVGQDAGLGILPPSGDPGTVRRIGLNDGYVAERVREVLGTEGASEAPPYAGAAAVLLPRDAWEKAPKAREIGIEPGLLHVYCVRQLDISGTLARETGAALRFYVERPDGSDGIELNDEQAAAFVRVLRDARPKRSPPETLEGAKLLETEQARVVALRSCQPGAPVPAVFPVGSVYFELDDR